MVDFLQKFVTKLDVLKFCVSKEFTNNGLYVREEQYTRIENP